jgi:hypothetical protein
VSALSAVLAGRRAAEALMLDAGTAKRPTGATVYAAGVESDATDDLFDSSCKVQAAGLQARNTEVAGRTATTVALELHLPVATAPLAAGDWFEVTTPHEVSTVPTGTVYRIVAPVEGSQKTARRYQIERVVS